MQTNILFDLDDTLIHTNRIFKQEIKKIKEDLALLTNKNILEINEFLDKTVIESYQIAKVNPKIIWPLTLDQLQKEYGFTNEQREKYLKILFGIYTIPPELKDGTKELLDLCKQKSVKIGLVTHASSEWTEFKLKSVGIKNYFTHIEVVDTNRAKSGEDWLRALNKAGWNIEDTWIIGDNVSGDIVASYSVGFRKLIWINKEDGWKMYKTGDLPEGTFTANSLKDVINIIFK